MTPRPRSADVVRQGRDAGPRRSRQDAPPVRADRSQPDPPGARPGPVAAPMVALSPWFSLVHVLGALAVPGPGLSRDQRLRCLAAVNQVDFVAAARPFRSGARWLPSSVVPPGVASTGLGSDLLEHPRLFAEHLLETGAARLDDELRSRGPQEWRYAVPRAEPWLRAYAAVVLQLWPLLREEWRQQLPVLEQEVDRWGRAAVLGRLPEQCTTVGPDVGIDADSLTVRLDDREARWADLLLVLAPSLLTTGTVFVAAGPDAVVVSHAVHAQATRAPGGRPGVDPLVVLLGRPRARLLTLVATPHTMGDVAQALRCTASNATHHVTALELAGLVVRGRRGRTVLVQLSPRGGALVALLREQRPPA